MHRDEETPGFPEVRFEVVDHSLYGADLDDFVGDFPARTAGTVEVEFKWGGPWASGIGEEIAVVVVLSSFFIKGFVGEMGRDAYRRVKSFLTDILPEIKTGEGTRGFDSPLAIGFESRRLPLRIEFVLPRDRADSAWAEATFDEIVELAAAELSNWETRLESEFGLRPGDRAGLGPVRIWLRRDEDSGTWSDFEGEAPGQPDWEILLDAGRLRYGE